jgi:ribosomal protein S3
MGQKVNPVGMRIGVNRNWNSRWYANDQQFNVFLNEDIKIRNYLNKELKDALLSHVEIERQKTDKGSNVSSKYSSLVQVLSSDKKVRISTV